VFYLSHREVAPPLPRRRESAQRPTRLPRRVGSTPPSVTRAVRQLDNISHFSLLPTVSSPPSRLSIFLPTNLPLRRSPSTSSPPRPLVSPSGSSSRASRQPFRPDPRSASIAPVDDCQGRGRRRLPREMASAQGGRSGTNRSPGDETPRSLVPPSPPLTRHLPPAHPL